MEDNTKDEIMNKNGEVDNVVKEENEIKLESNKDAEIKENNSVEANNSTSKNEKKKPHIVKRFFGFIGKLILVALLALAITILVRVFVYHKFDIFGFRLYQIMSGSMEPTIHVGDAVVTKEVPELNVGDILAYENGQAITVHRVIKVYTEGDKRMYEAQGDNNNAPDQGLIMPEQVKGKVVFTVKKAGEGINLLRKYGIIILIFAVGIIVIVALIRRLL